MPHIVACRDADLENAKIINVTVGTVSIAVVRCAGHIYAIHNSCPHKGAPLCDGSVSLTRGEIICPWHRFRFVLETGKSATNPEIAVQTFPVLVVDGNIVIDLPQEAS